MSDENEENQPSGKFGKLKNSTRRVKGKAQEHAGKAREVAGDKAAHAGKKLKKHGKAAAQSAREAGEWAAEGAREAGEWAAESASELKDKITADDILGALNRAGESVKDAKSGAGDALSEEAQIALDIIRARFPNASENLDDQAGIVALMPAQAHRQLIFAYAHFASRWIPVIGSHFIAGQLLKRVSKFVDDHQGDAPKKQRGVAISTYRWIQEYRIAKVIWEQQKGADGPGGGQQLN